MDRKEMIRKLGEHFGVKPKYLSAPSFAYEIRTPNEVYTIDRNGCITKRDGEPSTVEEIFVQGPAEAPSETAKKQAECNEFSHQGLDEIELKMDLNDHTVASLKNIINMLYSKQRLIMMAFESEEPFMDDDFVEDLDKEEVNDLEELRVALEKLGTDRCPGFQIDFEDRTFSFSVNGTDLSPERSKAFVEFCPLIAKYAKTLKRASFKQAQDDNPKYALRTWLIRIGMNGPEYKETRKTLLNHLEGSGAFRKAGVKDEA